MQGPEDQSTAARTLVSGMMLAWDEHRPLPDIAIRQSLGQAGELEVETKVSKLYEAVHSPLCEIPGDIDPSFDSEKALCLSAGAGARR